MTEFTKEYIRIVRICSYLIEPPASEIIGHLCDEIERLQQRIEELEQERRWISVEERMSEKSDYQKHLESMSEIEYKRLTQGDWSRNETDTRVRCTKDGEYPKIGQTVIYVEYGTAHLGKLLFKDDDGHEWQNDTGTQWFLKQTAIYWQPVITSLKEQYERERGDVNEAYQV